MEWLANVCIYWASSPLYASVQTWCQPFSSLREEALWNSASWVGIRVHTGLYWEPECHAWSAGYPRGSCHPKGQWLTHLLPPEISIVLTHNCVYSYLSSPFWGIELSPRLRFHQLLLSRSNQLGGSSHGTWTGAMFAGFRPSWLRNGCAFFTRFPLPPAERRGFQGHHTEVTWVPESLPGGKLPTH